MMILNNIVIRKGILIVILILVASVLNGCISSNAPPSEIVEEFHNNRFYRYNLMSEEYKNSTNLNNFGDAIANCKPSNPNYGGKYMGTSTEFIEVMDGSEKIEGDLASVEIKYLRKERTDVIGTQETKKINLIKEKDGWRLKDIYCELV